MAPGFRADLHVTGAHHISGFSALRPASTLSEVCRRRRCREQKRSSDRMYHRHHPLYPAVSPPRILPPATKAPKGGKRFQDQRKIRLARFLATFRWHIERTTKLWIRGDINTAGLPNELERDLRALPSCALRTHF